MSNKLGFLASMHYQGHFQRNLEILRSYRHCKLPSFKFVGHLCGILVVLFFVYLGTSGLQLQPFIYYNIFEERIFE